MDIVLFFGLLSNIVTELRKKGENKKADELSGVMKEIAANEQLKTEQKKQLEYGIKRAKSDSYINIVSDYYDNKDNVLDRCFFITKKGTMQPAELAAQDSRPETAKLLDEKMKEETLFFQRSLDGTEWKLYQMQRTKKKVSVYVVDYGEVVIDVQMDVPVLVEGKERDRLLNDYHVSNEELAKHTTGKNYLWEKKLRDYNSPYDKLEDRLHLLNNPNGKMIEERRKEIKCLDKYLGEKNKNIEINTLQPGLRGYDADALETLLICSNMSPEAKKDLESKKDPSEDYKKYLSMTAGQQKFRVDTSYSLHMLNDVYRKGDNRTSELVGAILTGRRELTRILDIEEDATRNKELGKLIREALDGFALQLPGKAVTSWDVYAAPICLDRILKLLDGKEELRKAVGLTEEERNYYEAAVRVGNYHREYQKILTDARKNERFENKEDFVSKMLTYQLITQMELMNQKFQENTRQDSPLAEGGNVKHLAIRQLDNEIKQFRSRIPLPLLQVARQKSGLQQLVTDMQAYVKTLGIYDEYMKMSDTDFIKNVVLGPPSNVMDSGKLMKEFQDKCKDYQYDSGNGVADWYIGTYMDWERTADAHKQFNDDPKTLANKVREEHRRRSQDPYSLESPKDVMQSLRKNIDAAWKSAHGESLKWKLTGKYKIMHSKLEEIKDYLDSHKGTTTVDKKKLESMMKELSDASRGYLGSKYRNHTYDSKSNASPDRLSETGKKRFDAALDVEIVAQDSLAKLQKMTRYTDFFSSISGEPFESFDVEKMAQMADSLYVNGRNYMDLKGWTELDELKLSVFCQDMEKYRNDPMIQLDRAKWNDPLAAFTPVLFGGETPDEIAAKKEYADQLTGIKKQNIEEALMIQSATNPEKNDPVLALFSQNDERNRATFWKNGYNIKYSNLDYQGRERLGLTRAILLNRMSLDEINDPNSKVEEKQKVLNELREVANHRSSLSDQDREEKWSSLLKEAYEGIKKCPMKPIDVNDVETCVQNVKVNTMIGHMETDLYQIIQSNKEKSTYCKKVYLSEDSNVVNMHEKMVKYSMSIRQKLSATDRNLVSSVCPQTFATQNAIDKKGVEWKDELTWLQDERVKYQEYVKTYDDADSLRLLANEEDPYSKVLYMDYYDQYEKANDAKTKNKWNEKILDLVDKLDKKHRIEEIMKQFDSMLQVKGDEPRVKNPIVIEKSDPILDTMAEYEKPYNVLYEMLNPDRNGNIKLVQETIRLNGGRGNKCEKAVNKAFAKIAKTYTEIHAFVCEQIADMDVNSENKAEKEKLKNLREIRDQLEELPITPRRYTTLLEAVDLLRTPPQPDSIKDQKRLRRVCDALNKYVPGLLENKKMRKDFSAAEKLDLAMLFSCKSLMKITDGKITDPPIQENIFRRSLNLLKLSKEYDGSERISKTYCFEAEREMDDKGLKLITTLVELRSRLKNPAIYKHMKLNNLNNEPWRDLRTDVNATVKDRIKNEEDMMKAKNKNQEIQAQNGPVRVN